MKYVVVGGTGTLGTALIKKLVLNKEDQVVCVSRDELKQKNLKNEIKASNLSFAIGDIRDKGSLRLSLTNAHAVFHVAALKHIDTVEENPVEGVKTNIIGTQNIAELAIEKGLPYVVFSSTDKAVEPINLYGMTKAISERHLFNLNEAQNRVKFAVYRWGNVVGSRGSVLHHFAATLKEQNKIELTHEDMSRFWINIDDAADFMLKSFKSAPKDRAAIPKMKASKVIDLACAVAHVLGISSFVTQCIGLRKGEKLAECISVHHEERVTSDNIDQYSMEELITMVRPLLEKNA